MIAIVRGIFLDPKIQVGFCGTDQEIHQQQREVEEGYLLSRRWISPKLPKIQENQFETIEQPHKRRSVLSCLGCEIQTVEATQNYLSHIAGQE